jgi:stage V sporulation protein B
MSTQNKFIKGALLLSIAGLLAKVLSMFFRIPLLYLVKDEGLGYYQTFYSVYLVLIALFLIGMPQAISKIVASKRAQNKPEEAYACFQGGLIVSVILGFAITTILLVFTNQIIELNSWSEGTKYVIYGLAISPVFVSVAGAIKGYFQGMQIMKPTAISQLIEGFVKVVVGISLTYVLLKSGFTVPMAVAGAAIGTSLGYITSAIYLYISYKRETKSLYAKLNKNELKIQMWRIFRMAIPVTIGASAFSIMNFIDSMTFYSRLETIGIVDKAATIMYGQIGKANSIINVPLAISLAVMISTIPAIAEANESNSAENLRSAGENSLKLSALLAFPAGIGLFVLAEPIMSLIYQSNNQGHIYLALFGICLPFLILGQALSSILQGIGRVMVPVGCIIVAAIVKYIVNYSLISSTLNGKGALIGSIVFCFTFFVLNYIILLGYTKLKVSLSVCIKPLVSAVVMGAFAIIGFKVSRIAFGVSISTFIAVASASIVYIVLLCALRTFSVEELEALPKGTKLIKILKKVKMF